MSNECSVLEGSPSRSPVLCRPNYRFANDQSLDSDKYVDRRLGTALRLVYLRGCQREMFFVIWSFYLECSTG